MGGKLPGISDCGAHVVADGVRFCVWAPFADEVAVTGDFTSWSDSGIKMEKGQEGCWFTDVKGALPGQEYKYVITHDGKTFQRNDPRALQLTPSEDSSVIVDDDFDWAGEDYQLPPMQEMIIYELHVGTFVRPDSALAGTFYDAMSKLDYLADLGVNVIEVMPPNAMWMDRWWGYTPDNIYAVDAAFGGRKAFKEFVKEAHARGIGVVLDVVYNHLSSDQQMDLWQFDGWQMDNHGGIYFYNDYRAKTPWGDTRPDYGRSEVRRYITDNTRMWIRDCHVDGLRVDATLFIRNYDLLPWDHPDKELPDGWKLMQEVNDAARQENPNALMIAEDLQGNDWITKPVSDGGAGFGSQWDPSMSAIFKQQLGPPGDESRDVTKMHQVLQNRTNDNPLERVIYSESHDTAAEANGGKRLDETIAPGDAGGLYARKRATLAAAILFTAPGIPMIFQGQEFEESGAFTHYAALDWSKTEKFAGILKLYKHLIALRLNKYKNARGLMGPNVDLFHVNTNDKVVAYHRWDQSGKGDSTVVVANFANQTHQKYRISFPATGKWWVRLNTDWQGYSQDFSDLEFTSVDVRVDPDDQQRFIGEIDIAPYSVLILSQDS